MEDDWIYFSRTDRGGVFPFDLPTPDKFVASLLYRVTFLIDVDDDDGGCPFAMNAR